MNASIEDLVSKDDVGEVIAKSIYDFFGEKQTIVILD